MTIVTPQQATPTSAPVQAIPVESTEVEGVQSPGEAEKPLSPQFAALARQQKLIRKQQMEIKAREDALKAKEQDYNTNYIPKSKFKNDPVSVLLEQGFSHEDIVNAIAQQGDPQSQMLKKFDEKFSSIEERLKKADEDAAAKQQKAYDQALGQIRNEVKLLVDADTTFEAIKANEAQEEVVELIKLTFEKDGTLLTVQDAATQVEEFLLEQAMKMAQLEKVKKKLQPATPEVAATPAKPVGVNIQAKQQPTKTLTNANTMVSSKPLSPKERRERAIAAFRGNLT